MPCCFEYYKLDTKVLFIRFWDILMFYQVFLWPQVKQSAIVSNKHGACELPHELSNDLRHRILGN